MARKVLFSFHFKADAWRASQVRNMGVVEGNSPVSDNDWESIKRGGSQRIEKWIDSQLKGRSCTVVLVGANTAGRRWINYEIGESWDTGKGVLGICIHNLKNRDGKKSRKGNNPFDKFMIEKERFLFGKKKVSLSSVVKLYDPPYMDSTDVYAYVKDRISRWVEKAIN